MNKVWAIVLAGGDGTRLKSLTDDGAGNPVPKQFCSLNGAQSLAELTVARAAAIVDPARITTIVSAPHARYWSGALRGIAPENIVVQPFNRGTAAGLLLPALRIYAHDPEARILILPSDQFVAHERVLEAAMRHALSAVGLDRYSLSPDGRGIVMLGLEAEEPDTELGYIVAHSPCTLARVRRFVEKPALEEARQLCGAGALWNSFIIACRAGSLIDLYRAKRPALVDQLSAACRDGVRLSQLYRQLDPIDFSREIAGTQAERLAVMRVPRCGWSELGTPKRLATTLSRHPLLTRHPRLARHPLLAREAARAAARSSGLVNLAERVLRTELRPFADDSPAIRPYAAIENGVNV